MTKPWRNITTIWSDKKNCVFVFISVNLTGDSTVDEKTRLVDTPEVPAEFKPIAEAEVTAFEKLAKVKDFDWTYMAPPAVMDFDAPHTGHHAFSGNKLGVNESGKSFISYSDYADAFVEKIFNPENHSVVGVYD